MAAAGKTEEHKRKILELLEANLVNGINSKILINQVTPRYSARLNDLKKEGYVFKTKRQSIGGSNFIRIWLLKTPTKNYHPKPIRYEFKDMMAIPVYE